MARLVYEHKGEWLLELEGDGCVFLRQSGGPLYYFGHVHNLEVPAVSGWRARIPAARRLALAASFEEARSTKDCEQWLVPDEQPSSLKLGDASMLVAHRALETNLALDRVVTELGAVASALRTSPPTDRLPNPDRAHWDSVPAAHRRPGPDVPEPQPGASENAQAAVDRFYANDLEACLARVASRPRQRSGRSVEAAPPPIDDTAHTFACRATGAPAGTVTLRLTPLVGGAELALSGFPSMEGVTVRVSKNDLPALHRQLVAGDARSVWKHDGDLAPFYCSQCDACYGSTQWKIYETSPTRVEGMCPAGHRRRMRAS